MFDDAQKMLKQIIDGRKLQVRGRASVDESLCEADAVLDECVRRGAGAVLVECVSVRRLSCLLLSVRRLSVCEMGVCLLLSVRRLPVCEMGVCLLLSVRRLPVCEMGVLSVTICSTAVCL